MILNGHNLEKKASLNSVRKACLGPDTVMVWCLHLHSFLEIYVHAPSFFSCHQPNCWGLHSAEHDHLSTWFQIPKLPQVNRFRALSEWDPSEVLSTHPRNRDHRSIHRDPPMLTWPRIHRYFTNSILENIKTGHTYLVASSSSNGSNGKQNRKMGNVTLIFSVKLTTAKSFTFIINAIQFCDI